MRAIVFEGTPAEVTEALKAMGVSALPGLATSPPSPSTSGTDEDQVEILEKDEDAEGFPVISTALARKVVSRLGLAPLQKKMLVEIYNAGEAGILGTELAEKVGYKQAQFRGMMGAWGRRIANTPGYDGDSHFFAFEWDYDASSYRYWLPESVREAIRIEVIERR